MFDPLDEIELVFLNPINTYEVPRVSFSVLVEVILVEDRCLAIVVSTYEVVELVNF